MVQIDAARLMASLQSLRSFGASGTGVVRQTFSDDDMAARHWLVDQMQAAGLDASIDGAGNVVGMSRNPGPAVIVGSHSDTQPRGGWLDGAMGVMYAIEIARALGDDPATAHLAVDVVAWSDEEGTYTSFLGSNSFVGQLTDEILQHTEAGGETVAEALERVGLSGVERARFDPGRHIAFLEPHIEQGPHLDDSGKRIGVVTSIVGIRSMRVTLIGEQNHAGSTPMARRKDAGAAMFAFAVAMRERLMAAAGPVSVWNIGNARLVPGGESIVPGRAELVVQFRDPSEAVLDAMQAAIMEAADETRRQWPVEVTVAPQRQPESPADMDPALRRQLCDAAERRVPGEWVEMPSAAVHDAMIMSYHVPSAMLFIPSIGGVSHDFSENSTELDIVTGCQVLADAVVSVLNEHRS
ncbi:MAG TPA: hydantoinase/carbamoylase family amidase [Ilumatobacter sp.]|nr:hydantoinase/carbamoylase family amidase [Ilumatobacter sp.]